MSPCVAPLCDWSVGLAGTSVGTLRQHSAGFPSFSSCFWSGVISVLADLHS